MALDIKNKLAEAWKSILEDNTYIAAAGIQGVISGDNATEKAAVEYIVAVNEVTRDFLNVPLWTANVAFSAMTHTGHDKSGDACDVLFQNMLDVMANTSTSALSTAAGFYIHAITGISGGVMELDEDSFRRISCQCEVKLEPSRSVS